MTLPIGVAALLAVLGLLCLVLALGARRNRGFEAGETVALDNETLASERLGLIGRPDRVVRRGRYFIPEEWKSARRLQDSHRLQLGVYLLLVEERYGVRPPHGVVILGDGSRAKVKNTEALRSEVLGIARKIREQRERLREEIRVRPPAWKCRVCGQRRNCAQARG
ncbi:PD-(D/E)XK nuclease family protein [Tautonia sociabilis]|uniref:Dna2/Cas4 domain-containing protein n=1 Tax=Tautonia sociabilis TaxID=2080755 RepID=A0A432MFB2_9BACT|nr:PD-(D/E)XK nuclease family protein [Tautonia sociabilis]RUL84606.1 Dna2/Cas4 domain-containing protein [Tautonia sociabilis]